DLPNRDRFGRQDVAVQFVLGTVKKRTRVDRKGGTSPRWMDTVMFDITGTGQTALMVEVLLVESATKTEEIGSCVIDLRPVFEEEESDGWHELKRKSSKPAGKIYIEFTFEPRGGRRKPRRNTVAGVTDDTVLPATSLNSGVSNPSSVIAAANAPSLEPAPSSPSVLAPPPPPSSSSSSAYLLPASVPPSRADFRPHSSSAALYRPDFASQYATAHGKKPLPSTPPTGSPYLRPQGTVMPGQVAKPPAANPASIMGLFASPPDTLSPATGVSSLHGSTLPPRQQQSSSLSSLHHHEQVATPTPPLPLPISTGSGGGYTPRPYASEEHIPHHYHHPSNNNGDSGSISNSSSCSSTIINRPPLGSKPLPTTPTPPDLITQQYPAYNPEYMADTPHYDYPESAGHPHHVMPSPYVDMPDPYMYESPYHSNNNIINGGGSSSSSHMHRPLPQPPQTMAPSYDGNTATHHHNPNHSYHNSYQPSAPPLPNEYYDGFIVESPPSMPPDNYSPWTIPPPANPGYPPNHYPSTDG
ncbi:hypothetical protein EV182_004535, partial [Spiromyces aspiralis]